MFEFISLPIVWFVSFWILGFVFLCTWHIFSYARVFVTAVRKGIPCTVTGLGVALVVTTALVYIFSITNTLLLLLLVVLGILATVIISVALWERRVFT